MWVWYRADHISERRNTLQIMKRINQNMKRINQNKVLENYNWTPDPRWDNKILSYDTVEHNWADWFLESVRELKPTLPKLEDIHL